MGLKQRLEAAALQVIEDAGLYTGAGLRSQESQETVRTLTNVVAVATPLAGARTDSQGRFIGQTLMRLDVLVLTDADQQPGGEDPPAEHSEAVEQIRDSLQLQNLAALLTAADDEITVMKVFPRQPALEPPERKHMDGFAWDCVCYESKI